MLVEIDYLMDAAEDLEHAEFASNETLKRAFARSIEIIGEAAKAIPDDVRRRHDHLPWPKMAGMRDKLIHDYQGIDYDIVWDVVTNKLPELEPELRSLKQDLQNT